MPIFEKRKRKNDELPGVGHSLISVLLTALIVAGLAIFFVASDAMYSTDQTNRIGLFVGHHYNDTDLGAVCADGLTERTINGSVADALAERLEDEGYTVDIFYDYGGELEGNYRADLLLVIHVRGCYEVFPSGYRVINANGLDSLDQCLAEYETATNLERLVNTSYMDGYYLFQTIAETTPVLLIEMGMLEADRDLLTSGQDRIVDGLANTITCFNPWQEITGA